MTDDLPRTVRNLVRGLDRAGLASALPGEDGAAWPYASLVLVAVDHDLAPILLLSDLAEHTKAMAADSRVSLLFDGTAGSTSRCRAARVAAGPCGANRRRTAEAAFSAHHPDAAMYAGFKDFNFYRVAPERAHLVGGFGKIRWLTMAELLPAPPSDALAESEAEIVDHMNADHRDAIQLYAEKLLGLPAGDWKMTGIDAEGVDLRWGGRVARLAFEAPIGTAGEARKVVDNAGRQGASGLIPRRGIVFASAETDPHAAL